MDKSIEIPEKLKYFILELKAIGALFMELNPHIEEICSKKNEYNICGSVCSIVMQEKENLILETIYKYLNICGYI